MPENARFSSLLDIAKSYGIGEAMNEAMAYIERDNEELKAVLPRCYGKLPGAPCSWNCCE